MACEVFPDGKNQVEKQITGPKGSTATVVGKRYGEVLHPEEYEQICMGGDFIQKYQRGSGIHAMYLPCAQCARMGRNVNLEISENEAQLQSSRSRLLNG